MKRQKITLTLICAFAALLILTACAGMYTVTFDANGGSIVSGASVQEVEKGCDAVPPTPERRGYAFDGWDGDYTAVTDDVSVRAKWVALYTVTFDLDGGTTQDTSLLVQNVVEGGDAVVPQVSREGYAFDGWSIENLTGISADLSVKAKWTREWTVRYQLAGGDVSNDDLLQQTVREGETPVDPKPTRAKYTFVRWNESIDQAKNTKYYTAVWEKTKYSASEISKMANAATAEITTYRPGGRAWKLGSGFFISQSGTMITNYHVIAGASEIHIKLGDTVYDDCFISAYDELLDIAVIQVNAYGVPYLELTNVSPKVGDVVYAVGSSLGLTGTFSSGIVSYANRVIDDVSFIQTTAPISSGNSGGPLINEYGEVIGVNTYSYSAGQNINLAVPAKDARDLSMINSKSFLLDEWFLMTSEYFLPGESVKDIGDGASGLVWFCGNGTTYKCILRDSMQLMVTRAYSSEQYVLIALKAEDYNKLLQLDYSIIAVKNTEDMAYYDEISPRGLTKDTVRDDDGSGWLVMMFQIPQTSLDRNFNYFGLYIEGSRTPVEYEYYSWIMYPDEMVDSEFFG